MNGAIGAAGERFANHLGDPRGSCRADDHLAAVLLLEAQRFFERVGVRLVHLEAGVLIANPGLGVVQPGLPVPGGDLLDADGNLHLVIWSSGYLVIDWSIEQSMTR